MKKLINILITTVVSIAILWSILTLFAEASGEKKIKEITGVNSSKTALVVYNPDPFANLDEQVCESFAQNLADRGWDVTIATVKAVRAQKSSNFDLYTFCANTYNWTPDGPLKIYIDKHESLAGKPVVAITLGGGSTMRSKRVLEQKIKAKNAVLLASETYWLWRPNDESRMDESNVKVAVDMAAKLGKEVHEVYGTKVSLFRKQF